MEAALHICLITKSSALVAVTHDCYTEDRRSEYVFIFNVLSWPETRLGSLPPQPASAIFGRLGDWIGEKAAIPGEYRAIAARLAVANYVCV